jgi:hypothetical protein
MFRASGPRRPPDNLHALVFEKVAKPAPEEIVIVDDQDADLAQRLLVHL